MHITTVLKHRYIVSPSIGNFTTTRLCSSGMTKELDSYNRHLRFVGVKLDGATVD